MLNKRLINTGEAAAAAFDPLQNFETVTYTGNGGTQKITGYIRKGAAFNGSSSKILLGTDIFNSFSNFSFSCWVNLNNAPSTFEYLFDGWDYQGATSRGIGVRINSSGNVQAQTGNSNSVSTITSSGTISYGSWTHIAVSITQSNTTISINGSTETPQSNNGFNFHTGTTYNLGAFIYTSSSYEYFLDGKIDQVRIFNRALDSSEVTTLYNEDYDSSTKSTTDIFSDGSGVALYELDEDANDTGLAGSAIDAGQSAVFPTSANLIGGSSLETFFNQRRTCSLSMWFKTTSTATGNNQIFSSYATASFNLFTVFDNGTIKNLTRYSNSTSTTTSDRSDLNDGNWHHIAVTLDTTSNVQKLYIDGVENDSQSVSSAGWNGTGIGAGFMGSSYAASIDDARIYSDVLSAAEVEYIFNADNSNIPSSNLELHAKFDGDTTDAQGNHTFTLTGSLTYSDPAASGQTAYNGTPTNINFLGMAFQPDFVWVKNRAAANPHSLQDTVRGDFYLRSNATDAEAATSGNNISSFDSNGFTAKDDTNGSYNVNGSVGGLYSGNANYVAWCWKAGGAAVSNTNGSITSSVSANTDAGFSIVKYTGNATSGSTIGHGLSQAPDLIFIKNIDKSANYHWTVYSNTPSTGATGLLYLNLTEPFTVTSSRFNNTTPTSSVITLGNDGTVNESGDEHIAYCFHSVDGYQKVGSYTGGLAGSSNVIQTGFKPRFVLMKVTNTANEDWHIFDSIRGGGDTLAEDLNPNNSNAETNFASRTINFVDNGFYWSNSGDPAINASPYTYIYLAIA
ncbi:LamG domain-containing protein [uncultured Polaribacter sp.]|uniref:LamG domain-containing protein n=1 Tax=uncultured Polaribacter sp. TaxID=174711 RepID=UPI00259B1836|nr:LamG domain-containing protein [uncultured Polaribacter sp.]